MNKAFVRDPDMTEERCPRCGAIGHSVQRTTVEAHVQTGCATRIAGVANFCPNPRCTVAYFDMFERTLTVDELLRPIYPKDPLAPICVCFGLTTADIAEDIAEGTNRRTRACVLRAQSDEAQCATKSPDGRSCIAEVQRYFLQGRNSV